MLSKYIIATIVIYLIANAVEIKGWTNLCPQTNLQLDCKCQPGEKCCFCPKPKMVLKHQHVAHGMTEVIGSHPSLVSEPCSPLVIPNGCTKGGVCPPCPGMVAYNRRYTNDICVDEPVCSSMAGFGLPQFAAVCSQFADVRYR